MRTDRHTRMVIRKRRKRGCLASLLKWILLSRANKPPSHDQYFLFFLREFRTFMIERLRLFSCRARKSIHVFDKLCIRGVGACVRVFLIMRTAAGVLWSLQCPPPCSRSRVFLIMGSRVVFRGSCTALHLARDNELARDRKTRFCSIRSCCWLRLQHVMAGHGIVHTHLG